MILQYINRKEYDCFLNRGRGQQVICNSIHLTRPALFRVAFNNHSIPLLLLWLQISNSKASALYLPRLLV